MEFFIEDDNQTSDFDSELNSFLNSFLNSLSDPVVVLNSRARIIGLNESARLYFSRFNLDRFPNSSERHYIDVLEQKLGEIPEGVVSAVEKVCAADTEKRSINFSPDNGSVDDFKILIDGLDYADRRYVTLIHKPGRNASRNSARSGTDKSRILKELHETTRDLMQAETVEEVARTAAKIASEYFNFATVGLRLLEDGKLRMKIAEEQDDRLEGRMPPAYEPGEGFVGRAFEKKEPVVHEDLESASEDVEFDYAPMQSAMLFPLGEFGIIGVASGERGAFDELDLELGRQFAADVESAMERARREETLRERERELKETTVGRNYLRVLMDTLPAGILIMDRAGVIKRTNRFLRELLGYEKDELIDKEGRLIFSGEGEILDRITTAVQDRDESYSEEITLLTKSEETVSVVISANDLLGLGQEDRELLCALIDITERKEKTRALHESKRRLSLALNVARAGVWEWNLQTGEEYWDENTERIFGLSPGHFGGNYDDFIKRVHPEDRRALQEAAEEAIESNGEFEKEFRIWAGDTDEKWLLSRGEVFQDEDGNPETMLGVTMDITERKSSQLALEESIEEKESLLKEIHHRVKNNLQIINSFLSMQSRNIESEAVDRAFLESISRVRAMAMVHEKLYQSPDLNNIDFEVYLRELVENLLETKKGSGEFDLTIEVDEYDLNLDKSIACGLIANELVTNALQHAIKDSENGNVTLIFRKDGSGGHRLQVQDDGSGFPEDFDLETSGSTGLDIVKSLVDFELNGNVRFENDNGAKVTVEF